MMSTRSTSGTFGQAMDGSETLLSFVSKLPHVLAANHLRRLIDGVLHARSCGKPIIWGVGGHVIKVGLGPVIIDLMKSGFVTGIAMNGSAAIHDFEIAMCDATSEDVGEQIREGRFGMASETGALMNGAIASAARDGIGMGKGLGRWINADMENAFPYRHHSILAEAQARKMPLTVHVAIGTDIIHTHPDASGQALGQTSDCDFHVLCMMVQGLSDGGVFLNVGSATILPQAFLQAIAVAHDLGLCLQEFTTANLDFIQHGQLTLNVVKRLTENSGPVISLTGHHEILVPLIAAILNASVKWPAF